MPFCSPKSVFTPKVCTQPEHPLFLISYIFHIPKAEARMWGHRMVSSSLPFPWMPLFSSGPPDPDLIGSSLRSYLTQCGLLNCSGLDCSEMTNEGHTEPVWALLKNNVLSFMISQPLNSSQRQGSRINKNLLTPKTAKDVESVSCAIK